MEIMNYLKRFGDRQTVIQGVRWYADSLEPVAKIKIVDNWIDEEKTMNNVETKLALNKLYGRTSTKNLYTFNVINALTFELPDLIKKIQINEKKRVVTIVWIDGAVTMAKCGMFDQFDVEKGISIAVMKRFFNSGTRMNKWLKEKTDEYHAQKIMEAFDDGNEYDPKGISEILNDLVSGRFKVVDNGKVAEDEAKEE